MPTYNEVDNIGPMIDALHNVSRSLPSHTIRVLVVDDNSPDGTRSVVLEKKKQYPLFVELLEGEKQGLGSAYIRGMRHAATMGADIVFQMDADFSHDPKDVPRLLKSIQDGRDFVIGSRYVQGGKLPEDWSLFRRLNSRVGNLVARVVAGIYPVRDCTAGFRAIRVSLLKNIDVSTITTQGYGFQVTLLHEAYIRGADIEELPVTFVDRSYGESKLGLSDITEFIKNAFAIRLRGMKTLMKFLMVGSSGVIVNLALFSIFLSLGMNKFLASPLAIELSIIWNFLLNNGWTFKARKTGASLKTRGLKFNIVALGSLSISYSTFLALSYFFPSQDPRLFQAASIAPATVVNYFFNSYWTFKHDVPSTTGPSSA